MTLRQRQNRHAKQLAYSASTILPIINKLFQEYCRAFKATTRIESQRKSVTDSFKQSIAGIFGTKPHSNPTFMKQHRKDRCLSFNKQVLLLSNPYLGSSSCQEPSSGHSWGALQCAVRLPTPTALRIPPLSSRAHSSTNSNSHQVYFGSVITTNDAATRTAIIGSTEAASQVWADSARTSKDTRTILTHPVELWQISAIDLKM